MSEQDNNTPTPATDAVRALHLFLIGSEDGETLPAETVRRQLELAHVDINKLSADIRKKISQAQNRLRLTEIAERAQSIPKQVSQSFVDAGAALGDLRRQVQQAIERISSAQPETALVFHRKLEESTDEDLASLLADLKELEAQANAQNEEGR
jgi:hypothetical protein